MSTLYDASVRTIENDTTAVLDVQVVHPDSMYISATPGFALMLLWESTGSDDPLASEIDLDTALDASWMRKYAQGFVRDVEIVELGNEPPAEAQNDYEHAYWKEPAGWLHGTIRVQVSDPAWISHLAQGQSWDSTAFEANSTFEACDPIRFEEAEDSPAPADDPHAGLIPVPRLFFLDLLSSLEGDYIWFPKYSDKAYTTETVYEDAAVTDDVLDSLVGEVVWYSSWGDGVGVLTSDRTVVEISQGSRGSTGFRAGNGKIGPARFDTSKKRLAEPLTISSLARTADPAVVGAEVDGATVRLTVYSFDSGRELSLQHEAAALALIASPECDSFDGFANATSKLGTTLHAKAEEHGIRFEGEIFSKFAKGIIVDATVEKTKDGEPVDFDAMSNDEVIAKLRENPWDTWAVTITVSDPAFVEHLPSITPYSYGFHWVADPEPWEDEPLMAGA